MAQGRVSLLLHPVQCFKGRKLTKLIKSATGTTYVSPPALPGDNVSTLTVTTDGVFKTDIKIDKTEKKKKDTTPPTASPTMLISLAATTLLSTLSSMFLINDLNRRVRSLEDAPNSIRRELIPSYPFQGFEVDALNPNKLKEKDDTFFRAINNPSNPLNEITKALRALSDYAKPRVVRISDNDSSGSGFIYSQDGIIITNHHVVDSGNKSVTVTFFDSSTKQGKVIGFDSTRDIAIIKVSATNLPTLKLATEEPKSGELAMALGNPLGLGWSNTLGVVSNSKRYIPPEGGIFPFLFSKKNVIQLDLPIVPGNSGGPVLNMQGEVIGIAEASIWGVGLENTSFCVPAYELREVIPKLIEAGKSK